MGVQAVDFISTLSLLVGCIGLAVKCQAERMRESHIPARISTTQ